MMPRLKPKERRQMVKLVRKGLGKKLAAEIFGVSRQTVWKWCKRAHHRGRESFKDLPRRSKERKINQRVEDAILVFQRNASLGKALVYLLSDSFEFLGPIADASPYNSDEAWIRKDS